jgi:hypothetical protein
MDDSGTWLAFGSPEKIDPAAGGAQHCRALERRGLLLLPDDLFQLEASERALISRDLGDGRAKSVSYDPGTEQLGGVGDDAEAAMLAQGLLRRFSDWARNLMARTFEPYAPFLQQGRASYRPRSLADEPASLRRDDRRVHVDAFPSAPVAGRRILRVFSNINIAGEDREWVVGGAFADYARRFAPKARALFPGEASLLELLGITRSRRTPYDQMMLQLHDHAKFDDAFQALSDHTRIAFRPGDTWVVFTDQTPHAAIKGRYALEQTFYLPMEAMVEPETSPLRILEGLSGRRLV